MFRSSSGSKTVTFRTGTEAEMNHAVEVIKESIQGSGGMGDPSDPQVCVMSLPQQGNNSSVLCVIIFRVVVLVERGECYNIGKQVVVPAPVIACTVLLLV